MPSLSLVSEPTMRHRPDELSSPAPAIPISAPTPTRLVVDAQNISLTFETADGRVEALSNVNLQVAEGEFVSFIGPSGCGKTTMLRVIADLQQPSSGTLLVNGMSAEAARLARSYGYVFQAPALFPWRTIEKNLKLPLEIMGFSALEQQQRVERYLSLVNLTGFERKFPWQLSGGMQQRVSIARALSFDPAMLLMDEPFGALDEIVRDHLNEQLLQLWKSTGKDGAVRHPFDSGSGIPFDQDRGDVAAARSHHRYHRVRFPARPLIGDPRDAGISEDRPARPRRLARRTLL